MADEATLTHQERELAIFILGPWLVGCFIDVMLQGVLFCQFSHYFAWQNDDSKITRLAVVGLAIITTLKSIHSFASSWILFILHFKDLNGAILLNYTAWWLTSSGIMVASIGIYVQSFFCYRLWIISRKKWFFIAPIVIVLSFAYVSICLATYYIHKGTDFNSKIATWFAAHLSSVFAGDLLITLSTAFFLLRSRKEVLPQTVGVIDALIRLTFQTAAPAALCAMFNLIFSQVYSGSFKLVSSGFNQTLPKLYAFSMMWTLNARHEIRSSNVKKSYEVDGLSAPRSENVELGSYNVQRMRTQGGTHSIDVRRMFHHSTISSSGMPSSDGTETKILDYKLEE